MDNILLDVKDLKVFYSVKSKNNRSFLRSKRHYVKAVNNISFQVRKNQTFGIVGESGCGKSTLAKTIVRLLKPTDGEIYFQGRNINTEYNRKELSKNISIIFQDPYSSLDPRFTVGRCIAEPLIIQGGVSRSEIKERVLSIMKDVGLTRDQYTRYPHEFSGGQRQRIGIARALITNPKLVICDEPVSALDVSIQAQILNLMKRLQNKYNLTYIFISHDLSVVKHICDYIAVMYFGNIVEMASRENLFDSPVHPYTRILLNAIPIPDPKLKRSRRESREGTMEELEYLLTREQYEKGVSNLYEVSTGHFVADNPVWE